MQTAKQGQEKERRDLDGQYGSIGISAVAAALRYRSEPKNPAYAPVTPSKESSSEEAN